MLFNDVLRSLRYGLNIDEAKMLDIIQLSQTDTVPTVDELTGYLASEDSPEHVECSSAVLEGFLNGLITYRRGPSDRAIERVPHLSNNLILKKLRIAFELQENDLFDIFRHLEFNISKPELSALFRKEGQKNFRACHDQFLRNFLKGLNIWIDPSKP